jgi:exonuclease SbcD
MNDAVRFIVTGDLHYRGTNPRARTDDFTKALKEKLGDVYRLANYYDCAGVIIPGDITDSPGITLPVIGDLHYLLSQCMTRIYAVPGNHDIWGSNPETLPRTPFGLLTRVGTNLWDLNHLAYVLPLGGGYVRLTGTAYSTATDRGISDYLIPDPEAKEEWFHDAFSIPEAKEEWFHDAFSIHVAHGMLLDKPPGYDLGRYTLIDDVANHPDAPDVLICGHEHIGFGVIKRNKTTFINPGALCRLTAHPAEIERQVQACLLTIEWVDDNEYQCDTELIPLQSARPGEEVLSREHLEEQASREELISSFMTLLAEEGGAKFLETQDIVEDIARRESIPRDVVDEALRRIGQAREALRL